MKCGAKPHISPPNPPSGIRRTRLSPQHVRHILLSLAQGHVQGIGPFGEQRFLRSFQDGLLGSPQYTRPAEYRGMKVPDVLLSGDHKAVNEWRQEQREQRTRELRSDLLDRSDQ